MYRNNQKAQRVASMYLQSSRMKELMMEMEDNDEAWDYVHDDPIDRRVKASTLLRALLRYVNLSDLQERAVGSALDALTYTTGNSEPWDVISDKDRKMVRHLAYKYERKVTPRLRSLPAGIIYKEEIRRLFGR